VKKKLSVDIPMSLKRNLDIFCAEENELIKDVVAQAIQQYISKAISLILLVNF
jgi:hypothetical protein